MSSKSPHGPGIFSAPRLRTLLASLLVSLSSGTNYVSPNLGEHTSLDPLINDHRPLKAYSGEKITIHRSQSFFEFMLS